MGKMANRIFGVMFIGGVWLATFHASQTLGHADAITLILSGVVSSLEAVRIMFLGKRDD